MFIHNIHFILKKYKSSPQPKRLLLSAPFVIIKVMDKQFYNLSAKQTLNKLKTSLKGLNNAQVEERLMKFGLNEITVQTKPLWKRILEPFLDIFMLVLIVAAGISIFHGDTLDAIIILVIVAVNAIISYVQDYSTERILRELRNTSEQIVEIIRDGKNIELSFKQLVPGDIVILREGDKVPADGRIVTATSVRANESLLTGESLPVSKNEQTINEENLEAYEQTNMLFQGSFVVSGNLTMVVTSTGSNSEFGKLAKLSSEISSESPVQVKINKLVFYIIIASLILAVVAFGLSMWRGMDVFDSLKFVMALSVSVVPEGLPIAISIILALGMRRMAAHKALVRNLRAIETVGVITTIATDKTGTLTQNRLTIQKTFSLASKKLLNDAIFWSSNPSHETGDPLDAAFSEYIKKQGVQFATAQPAASFSFNQDLAMSGNLWHEGGEFRLSVKGAPEVLVENSTLSEKDKSITNEKIQEFASQGLRVIAVANIKTGQIIDSLEELKDMDYQLELTGIVGVADILRPESAEAIKIARKAGVSVRMITGDHPETAYHIGKELGLADNKDQIFDASQIKQMGDKELETAVKNSLVFARITPESKYKILKILENTEITAMTGDGVNDVPALAAANVGFAMGSGSEIAKDASDIILLDDNFTSIVTAMREGRVIVANIRRMLFYALSTNAGEALTMIGSLIIGVPLPLAPVQILWINLVTDTSLIIPLGLESASGEIMSKKPNKPDTPILSRTTIIRMIMVAALMSIISIIVYVFYSEKLGHAEAQTLTFTALATAQWGNALNARSNTVSLRHRIKTKNKSFALGMTIAIVAQAAALFTPLSQLLHVATVPFTSLLLVSIVAFISPIILVEVHKLFVKNKA